MTTTTVNTAAKARILVVEDDANIVDSLDEYLSNFNYSLDIATTGTKAIEMIETADYDLILLDVHLPDFSGMDVLKQIKEHNNNLPVLVMTGFISTDSAIEAMKLGAHEFITKPFDLDRLSGMINRLVKKAPPIQGLATFSMAPKPVEGTIIGQTPEMVEIAKIIGQVARSDASVLILGESGTGKELVAQSVYANSNRACFPSAICDNKDRYCQDNICGSCTQQSYHEHSK